jgi:thiol:disulfide interchange protein
VKKIVCLIVLLVGLSAAPLFAYFSNTWFEGASGWKNAARQSRTLGVPMFVYFRVDWCPHCRSFDDLLGEAPVRGKLAKVIKVVVDPERGDEERRLFKEAYGGTGFPTLFLHPPDGSPRRLSHGGPAEKFLAQFPE